MHSGELGRLARVGLASLSKTDRTIAWLQNASAPTPSRTDVEQAARSAAATGEFFCTRCHKHTGDPNREFFHWVNDQMEDQHKYPKLRPTTAAPPSPTRVLQMKWVDKKPTKKKRAREAEGAGCAACAAERAADAAAELQRRPLKRNKATAPAPVAPSVPLNTPDPVTQGTAPAPPPTPSPPPPPTQPPTPPTPRAGCRTVDNRPLTVGEQAITDEYLVDQLHDPDQIINDMMNFAPVSRLKIRCLEPTGWLNDEVVNFFMGLLQARNDGATEADALPRCHFFPSHFYTKLCGTGAYEYARVKRWTKNVDVFAKDLLICPIHWLRADGDHWTLAVVNLLENRFEYFDSLRGGDGGVLANLRRYMKDVHLEKRKDSWDDTGWTDHIWDAGTPRQRNGFDCGVFMCKTADYYAQDAHLDFSPADMGYFRRRLALEIHDKALLA